MRLLGWVAEQLGTRSVRVDGNMNNDCRGVVRILEDSITGVVCLVQPSLNLQFSGI